MMIPGGFREAAELSLAGVAALATELEEGSAYSPKQHEVSRLLRFAVEALHCTQKGKGIDSLLRFLIPGQSHYVDLSSVGVSLTESLQPDVLVNSLAIRVLEAIEAMPSARLALKTFCESGRFDLAAKAPVEEDESDVPHAGSPNDDLPTFNQEPHANVSGSISAAALDSE